MGKWVNGLFQGVRLSTWNKANVDDLNTILDNVITAGRSSQVVNLVMVPTILFDAMAENIEWEELNFTRPTSLDRRTDNGYVPRNKKLLTSPYIYLQVDICNERKDYQYENLDGVAPGQTFTWLFAGVCSPNPEVIIMPEQYNNRYRPGEYALIMRDFPQCAFTTDSYRAWLAYKTSGGFTEDTIRTGVGVAANLASGNIVGAGMNLIGSWANQRKEAYNAGRDGGMQGHQGGSSLVATRRYEVIFKTISMTKEFAMSSDDFLDKWGYTTYELKVPNRNVRPHWTYTQTKECAIKGKVPGLYARKIESIYNKGITFWKNISEIGNYSLDNRV